MPLSPLCFYVTGIVCVCVFDCVCCFINKDSEEMEGKTRQDLKDDFNIEDAKKIW